MNYSNITRKILFKEVVYYDDLPHSTFLASVSEDRTFVEFCAHHSCNATQNLSNFVLGQVPTRSHVPSNPQSNVPVCSDRTYL